MVCCCPLVSVVTGFDPNGVGGRHERRRPMEEPGWADIADWYDGVVRSGRTPHGLATRTMLGLAGDVTGRRVLDVACGQGIATRALARAGAASVVGLDLTE